MKRTSFIIAIILVFFIRLNGQKVEPGIFVIPENLKDNVEFWKKIYTEVPLTEGLLHDREYPLIIYGQVTTGKLRGRSRRNLLRKHIIKISNSLKIINRGKESDWSVEEKRIVDLFQKYANLKEIKRARYRIRFQQGQKDRFKEGLERSGAYLDYIKSIFKQYNIPHRIAYLPHVESSFNPKAYSKVGAAGMWQFMRHTGRLYLTINYKVDERKDPFKSTVAAAKHLQNNYNELKSWPLAITAYNHGLASIKRAVRITKSRDLGVIIEKYKNRRFKFASKNFYGCFLAASEISMNAATYFPNIKYHPPIKYNELVLKNYIKPSTLSRHLEITQEELAKLNPSIRSTVFRRQLSIPKGFSLHIPGNMTVEVATQKIANIPSTLKSSTSKDFEYYSVRKGNNLSYISRRFGVSMESIIEANNIDSKHRIYIGQILRIPKNGASNLKPSKKKIKHSTTNLKKSPEPIQTNAQVKTKEPPAILHPNPLQIKNGKYGESFDSTLYNLDVKESSKTGTAQIRVAIDETLGHYADWLQIPTSQLRRLNRLGYKKIRLNQKLLIPTKNNSLEQFNKKRLEYHMALEEDFFNEYYVSDIITRKVRYGETLWSICNRDNEIPIWLFKKYNQDINIEKIKIDTNIRLPVIKSK
jgi:membrane-bound lytic murein transglycosylase D